MLYYSFFINYLCLATKALQTVLIRWKNCCSAIKLQPVRLFHLSISIWLSYCILAPFFLNQSINFAQYKTMLWLKIACWCSCMLYFPENCASEKKKLDRKCTSWRHRPAGKWGSVLDKYNDIFPVCIFPSYFFKPLIFRTCILFQRYLVNISLLFEFALIQ